MSVYYVLSELSRSVSLIGSVPKNSEIYANGGRVTSEWMDEAVTTWHSENYGGDPELSRLYWVLGKDYPRDYPYKYNVVGRPIIKYESRLEQYAHNDDSLRDCKETFDPA